MAEHLTWKIGEVIVTRVEERINWVDGDRLMPDFEPSVLDPHRDWLTPHFFSDRNDKMALSVHTFVVVSGDTTIVVDTCVGPGEHSLPGDPEFIDRLDAAIDGGLDAVDVVLCTHLHYDHVGWNLREVDGEQVPTFPNARYLFGEIEVEHTRNDDHMGVLEPSIDPLIDAGLADLVDLDHVVTDTVRLIPTTGHTPGHVSILIESEGASALITGDAAHSPLQLAQPELASANFDYDREKSTQTRRDIVARFLGTDTLILGTHFAPPTGGHLIQGDAYVRFSCD